MHFIVCGLLSFLSTSSVSKLAIVMSVRGSTADVEKSDPTDTTGEDSSQDGNASNYLTGFPLYSILVGLGLALFLGAMDMAMLGTVSPSPPSSHK